MLGQLAQSAAAIGAAGKLDGLGRAAQAVEHKGAQLACSLAALATGGAACLGRNQRQQHAQDRVGHKRDAGELRAYGQQEAFKDSGADQGDGNGRDGVCIEDLEQLDIRGDEAYELTLAAALELGGCQLAQGSKHQVADVREQAEGDVVVAELLAVVERPTRNAAGGAGSARGDKTQPQGVVTQSGHKSKGTKRRDKCGGKHADAAQGDSQYEPSGKRAHESHHAPHNGRRRATGMVGARCRGGSGHADTVAAGTANANALGSLRHGNILSAVLGIRIRRELLLAVPHARIDAHVRQELAVSPALGNATALQHQDLVGVDDRRQAMRHHDHGVIAGERRDNLANRGLACSIDVAGGLVKHIDGRVVQQGARHAHALTLTARKVGAAFVNSHVEPAVCLHKGSHARAVKRVQKLGIGGIGLGEQQVFAQGAGEQIAVGGH